MWGGGEGARSYTSGSRQGVGLQMKILPAALFVLAYAGTSVASTPAVVRAAPFPPFQETVQEEVAVSGTVVVGVALSGAHSGDAVLSGLRVPRVDDEVCVLVRSRDGVYFARNGFGLADADRAQPARRMQFNLDASKQKALLRQVGDGDLAVAVHPGSCESRPATWLLASPDGAAVDAAVEILVNSFDATDVFMVDAAGQETDCQPYLEGRRSIYDYRCRIDGGSLQRPVHRVEVRRELYGRPLPTVTLDILVEPAP